MDMTGNILDYTAHMYSSQGQTSSGRQSKVVRAASAMACAARPRERAALQAQAAVQRGDVASGRWGRRGCTPAATGAKIPFILPIRRTAVCPLERAGPAPWTRDRLQVIPGDLQRCPMRVSPSSSAWPDNACAGVSPAPTMAPLSRRPPRPCPMTLTCDTRYALSPQLGNRHPRRPVAQGIRH
jgi:hypothetical protein